MFARLAALLEDALDLSSGDRHPELRHRRPVGQGEDVGRLDRLIEGIHERLAHHHARQQPVDPAADVHGLEGEVALLGPQGPEPALIIFDRGRDGAGQFGVRDRRQ
jgi:hypothetical protein